MTTPAFTPAPWSTFHDHCRCCKRQGDENWFLDGPPLTEHGGFAKGADASLIASAPELYEAVELFVAAGNMSAFSADANKALAAAHDKALAALAKARGAA